MSSPASGMSRLVGFEMAEKQFKLTFASRDGNNQLRFSSEVVSAKSKAIANQIGKARERPAEKLWFRGDLTYCLSENVAPVPLVPA